MANSTRSLLCSRVATFAANCSGARTCSSSVPSCTSPHVPRVLTLVSTFFRSPTPVASVCISPRPLCTCSSRSLTCLNDSPSRCSSVVCSFSSTVARIWSSLLAVSRCSARNATRRWCAIAPAAARWRRERADPVLVARRQRLDRARHGLQPLLHESHELRDDLAERGRLGREGVDQFRAHRAALLRMLRRTRDSSSRSSRSARSQACSSRRAACPGDRRPGRPRTTSSRTSR